MNKIKIIGVIFTLFSFVFIVNTLIQSKPDFSSIVLNPSTFIAIILSIISCCIVVFGFGWAWRQLLIAFSGLNVPYRSAGLLFVQTNIGKYLPGNVMHFAARNIFGKKWGLTHTDLALSSLFEVLLILFVLFTGLFFFQPDELWRIIENAFHQLELDKYLHYIILTVFFVITISLFIAIRVKGDLFKLLEKKLSPRTFMIFFQVMLVYIGIFCVLGFSIFIVIKFILQPDFEFKFLLDTIVYFALAWLAGFIVIGSPGGIGVRESVLIVLLGPVLGESTALLAALIHRFIYITGEVFSFLLAQYFSNK